MRQPKTIFQPFTHHTILLSISLILAACNAPLQSVVDETNTNALANQLAIAAILDSELLTSAMWDPSHEMLTIKVAAKTTDNMIILTNVATNQRIALNRITADGTWVARRSFADLGGAIPCLVEAVSEVRVHRLAVTDAPNCSAVEGNVLPIPTITQPAATVTTQAGQSLTFVATITDPDNNGPYTYYWNFANAALATKTTANTTTSTTAPITFEDPGNYAILLRVTDATGEFSLQNAQRHILVVDGDTGFIPTPTVPPLPTIVPTPLPTTTPIPTIAEPITPSPSPNPVISPPPPGMPVTKADLGKSLFFDESLSEPSGLSCANCHHSTTGWADPNQSSPVSLGPLNNPGLRNAPSTAYATFVPELVVNFSAIGGLFRDGSAANMLEAAKASLLNIEKMSNITRDRVVQKIQVSDYAAGFEQVYGVGVLENIDLAFDNMADALAAYLASDEMNAFSSKFDAVQAEQATFTEQESAGLALFTGKAFCSGCHTARQVGNTPALFSNFGYRNLGLPPNIEPPFNSISPPFVDLGLGALLSSTAQNGKFRIPLLRNVADTPPYMHNGVLKTLEEVVRFKNTRDVPGKWPAADINENITEGTIGNMGLTPDEEAAIVAFLKTLSDGFNPALPAASPTPTPPSRYNY